MKSDSTYCSIAGLLSSLLLLACPLAALGGSATWQLTPASNDWNTASNWSPATVPNDPRDIATFDASNVTGISISANTDVKRIAFNPGANAFTITVPGFFFSIGGGGIRNASTSMQSFVVDAGYLRFRQASTAGRQTSFGARGGSNSSLGGIIQFFEDSNAGAAEISNETSTQWGFGGITEFYSRATAGNATLINAGGVVGSIISGGTTHFFQNSSGGNGTFISEGAAVMGGLAGGETIFFNTATAGDGTFIANGGSGQSSFGGTTQFNESSTAGNALLIANSGESGGFGGSVQFAASSTGGTARVQVFGNGSLDISARVAPGVTLGSIAGTGTVSLGGVNLTVGAGDLDSRFSGVIRDGGFVGGNGGSLTKIGAGNLTLTRGNTYTGGTTVRSGSLFANNQGGSATGQGNVEIAGGTLGGDGSINGAVTVGVGNSGAAALAPGTNTTTPGLLRIRNLLTFNAAATYECGIDSGAATADRVAANGVTISGATFSLTDAGSSALPSGTVFTVIANTSASPIAGTFANLPDGSTFTAGPNTFAVNYAGGDGNDLTLTIVP